MSASARLGQNPKDLDSLVSWHANWQGLRAAVLGLGVTGFSVADTLAELGAEVLVIAESADPDQVDILDVIGVQHVVGRQISASNIDEPDGAAALLTGFAPQVLVVSPGVRPDSPIIRWAKDHNVAVWVDIELAWRLRDKTEKIADWLLVTGTNGKTTTTQLVEAMLTAGGLRAAAGGNIGTPMLDLMRDPIGFDAVVVELSSFQLHYLPVAFSKTGEDQPPLPGQLVPLASVCLNIADDHLDWHGTFDAYRAAKAKVFEKTQVACVYNVQDSETEAAVENADVTEGARAIGFSLGAPGMSQVGYVEDVLADRAFLDDRKNSALEIATVSDIANIGFVTPHLLANVAAATALARSAGVEPIFIREAIRGFKLDAHRIEFVGEWGNVKWFDDSKATNPHAAAASLASFDKVVWVLGGLLKGVELAPIIRRFKYKLRAAIIIGQAQEAVLAAFAEVAPNVSVHTVAANVEKSSEDAQRVMLEACALAKTAAQEGDVVLLAPAAASMDQFVDYADRGTKFAAAAMQVNR